MSVKLSALNAGAGMAVPILWAPGKWVLSAGKSHVHKIPRFRGGGGYFGFFWGGGGSADFIFMGARIFLTIVRAIVRATQYLEVVDKQMHYFCCFKCTCSFAIRLQRPNSQD